MHTIVLRRSDMVGRLDVHRVCSATQPTGHTQNTPTQTQISILHKALCHQRLGASPVYTTRTFRSRPRSRL